ncbi:MAG: hypothetical protein ACK4N5_24870, partial [Myxococcales bacterium]
MGLNPYLVHIALERVKKANFDPAQPLMPQNPSPPMGPRGSRGPLSLIGGGLDRLGGAMVRHPLLTAGTVLAGIGAKKLYDDYNVPKDSVEVKQADVPPTPM